MLKIFVIHVFLFVNSVVLAAAVFDFDAYHTPGADPFETMSKLVELVRAEGGKDCKIVMSPKTYVFKKSKNYGAFLELKDIKNLTVDGRGARVRISPYNEFCKIQSCENVAVKNFDFALRRPAFTQGDIVDVHADGFTFRVDKGYPKPPSNEFTLKEYPTEKWRWGSVMERKTKQLKKNFCDHLFIESVEKTGKGLYRIRVRNDYVKRLTRDSPICDGDVWVMPVYRERNPKIGGFLYTVSVVFSKDILVENVRVSSTSHAGFSGSSNYGKLTLKNCVLTWREGSKDMISSWRDGSHFKNNKVGPTLDGCRFEGMLDDAINISAAPAFVIKEFSPTSFQMRRFGFSEGDRIGLLYGNTGEWKEGLRAAKGSKGLHLNIDKPVKFTVWKPIPEYDIVSGNSNANALATQFFNMEYINDGFAVRNCRFGVQRRCSMIIRAHNGVIENNVIDGGSGICISNEVGSWFEGPLPKNIVVRNNSIKVDRECVPVFIGGRFLGNVGNIAFDFNISFDANSVYAYSDAAKFLVHVSRCNGVKGRDNKFFNASGGQIGAEKAVRAANSSGVSIQ